MKVEAPDSFFESLERLAWYDTKLWKVWEFIKRTIPRFFKNIWRFRKELAQHEWWDYRYTLEMLYRSLSIMVVKLEKDGIEGMVEWQDGAVILHDEDGLEVEWDSESDRYKYVESGVIIDDEDFWPIEHNPFDVD